MPHLCRTCSALWADLPRGALWSRSWFIYVNSGLGRPRCWVLSFVCFQWGPTPPSSDPPPGMCLLFSLNLGKRGDGRGRRSTPDERVRDIARLGEQCKEPRFALGVARGGGGRRRAVEP